ncbi:MAG: hypothetical protein ACTSXK_15290 [Promethearchaeota archaeon]
MIVENLPLGIRSKLLNEPSEESIYEFIDDFRGFKTNNKQRREKKKILSSKHFFSKHEILKKPKEELIYLIFKFKEIRFSSRTKNYTYNDLTGKSLEELQLEVLKIIGKTPLRINENHQEKIEIS